jgi:thiol-disulfide isomerase/thioredoxin
MRFFFGVPFFVMPSSTQSLTRRTAGAVIGGACLSGIAAAIDTRELAPNWWAKTLDGEKLTKDSTKGKTVLLQFWTTWCPYCRRDQEAVETIAADFKEKGLLVLAVNVAEPKKKVKQYLDQSPRSCKIVLTEDTNLVAIYAAKAFPVYVLIDGDGYVAGRQNGAAGEDALRSLLRKAKLESE